MAETMLALGISQVVTPFVVAAMPPMWKQIEKVLRRIPRDPSQDTNLACINTILDTLARFPDDSWTSESHIQALLNEIVIKTESMRKMVENDKTIKRLVHRREIEKNIQSIALMMQLLETNVRVRQATTFSQCIANHDVNTARLDLDFFMKNRENLIKDLLDILRKDNLEPVLIQTREDYEASQKSSTYPSILYDFQCEGASGYPRTLATSRGVRGCIELLLKKLRDLKLMQKTRDTGGSVLVGVALYDYFTEILPKVLMDHLVERRPTLQARTTQQFNKNLRFFRWFSVSSTFKAIQGPNGLDLEEEDKVLHIDLQQSEWATWEDVRKMSLEVGASSGRATRTASGNIESHECTLCGVLIAGESVGPKYTRHWEKCFAREERYHSSRRTCCPICHEDMDHMSQEGRSLHANACVDRVQN